MNLITITATGLLAVAAPIAAPWLTQDGESASATTPVASTTDLPALRSAMSPAPVADAESIATMDALVRTNAASGSGMRAALAGTPFAPLAVAPRPIDDEEAARREAEALQARIAELQAQIERLEAAGAARPTLHEAEARDLAIGRDAALAQRRERELQAAANELDVRVARVHSERASIEQRIAEIEQVLASLGSGSRDARAALKAELAALDDERHALEDASAELEAKYHDLLVAMGEGENLDAFFVDADEVAERAEKLRREEAMVLIERAEREAETIRRAAHEDARIFVEVERAQREAERAARRVESERAEVEREMERLHRRLGRAVDTGRGDEVKDLELRIVDLHDAYLELDEELHEIDAEWLELEGDFFAGLGGDGAWRVFGDEDECEDECEDGDEEAFEVYFMPGDGGDAHGLKSWLERLEVGEHEVEALFEKLAERGDGADPFAGLELRRGVEFEAHDSPFDTVPGVRVLRGQQRFPGGDAPAAPDRFPGRTGSGAPNINAGGDVTITNGGGSRDGEIIELLREIRDEVRGLRDDLRSMHDADAPAPRAMGFAYPPEVETGDIHLGYRVDGTHPAPAAPSTPSTGGARPATPSRPALGAFAPSSPSLPSPPPPVTVEGVELRRR